jgi:hypothetical protein
MAGNKTVARSDDVATVLAAVEPEVRRTDAAVLIDLMQRVSGAPPVLWGPSMIGFGAYQYRYDSGREGTMFRIGFAPRKANMVVYLVGGFTDFPALLARLGKHKTGKSCLYLGPLADVDLAVLEEMAARSWAAMAERYPLAN